VQTDDFYIKNSKRPPMQAGENSLHNKECSQSKSDSDISEVTSELNPNKNV
jgi:hypothetical protein